MEDSTDSATEEASQASSTTSPVEKQNLKLKEALKRSRLRTLEAMTIAARERKNTTRQRAPIR
jgi:hypothetical protein